MILLLAAMVMVLALIAIRLSNRYGVPSLLLFIILGMCTRLLGLEFDNYDISEKISTLALIVIIFYGGFGTNLKMGKKVIKESILLSTLGVILTAIGTGFFVHYIFSFPLIESLLLGSVVGSTDYASVSSILSSKNLNLKYNTAPMLELESGSNDPMAYTLTMIFLSILLGAKLSIPLLIAKQMGIAIILGLVAAYIFIFIIGRVDFSQDGLFTIFVSAMALGTYSSSILLGGNGYLAIYLFGIIIGNQEFRGKRETVFFYDGLSELMQIGLFYLLGLLCVPSSLLKVIPVALGIILFMTFVLRPLTVWGILLPFKGKKNQVLTLSWAGLRGAAAIAFAIMVINSGVELSLDIYHIVFGVCILSSFFQGSLMEWVVDKLNMLDPNDTVLKTFNYYQDKSDIGFLQTKVYKSEMVGKKIKDLNIIFDFIVAKLIREGKTIVPYGETEILEGDILVLGGKSHFDSLGHELMEFSIGLTHPWKEKEVKNLGLKPSQLILMIQRNEKILVPRGDTIIKVGDKVIYTKEKEKVFPKK